MKDLESYQGPFVAIPKPLWDTLIEVLTIDGYDERVQALQKCVTYEPDNHHNAALCPYCNMTPSDQQIVEKLIGPGDS